MSVSAICGAWFSFNSEMLGLGLSGKMLLKVLSCRQESQLWAEYKEVEEEIRGSVNIVFAKTVSWVCAGWPVCRCGRSDVSGSQG